ncbi:hypothetical protein C8F01DRAFT_1079867 [Mycena amicta]|nr:hypothetical protein C8F01DRAFT_1079867 [Mycena amicta]
MVLVGIASRVTASLLALPIPFASLSLPAFLVSSGIMPKGVLFPEALCWAVVRMAACLRRSAFTGVSPRSQRTIHATWRKEGVVRTSRTGPELRGIRRPSAMRYVDLADNPSLIFQISFAQISS